MTPEERREYQRKYRIKNRAYIREYQRQWGRDNRLKGLRKNKPRVPKEPFKVKTGSFVILFD